MIARVFGRVLLIPVLSVLPPTAATGQTPCAEANVSPSALVCAFGAKITSPPLISGEVYISVTDATQKPYPTFLYTNQNTMPATHRTSGEAIAASILPLDANGKVDLANGKIAVIAEGMSNTQQEMLALLQQFIRTNPAVNPKLQFVNLAQGGCDLICWLNKGVGAIDPQVQIVLLKHSNNRPQTANGAPETPQAPFTTAQSKRFPNHVTISQGMLKQRILDLKSKYPNLRLLYLTSRSYGGWSCAPAAASYREPVAFEEGFAVKWLIESQIAKTDPQLDFSIPNAKAPWLAWGPYLWDSSWPQNWFEEDGTHPCAPGETAVAKKWFDFLMLDSTSRPWFRDNVAPATPANLSAKVMTSSQINLSWSPAADNSGSVKYRLFRGGLLLKVTAGVSYADVGLQEATQYCYTVSAVDSAGNQSAASAQACAATLPTSVAGDSPQPLEFKLLPNYPNPFGGGSIGAETEISFQLPGKVEVEVRIYNLFGEEIRTLVQTSYAAGYHRVRWDGKDRQGNTAVNGVYFCRLRAGGVSRVMKMTVLH